MLVSTAQFQECNMNMFKIKTSDNFKGLLTHILSLLVASRISLATVSGNAVEDDDNWSDESREEDGEYHCSLGHAYIMETQSCLPVSTSGNNYCNYDAQCTGGPWGEYSRCSLQLHKCECLNVTVFLGDMCQILPRHHGVILCQKNETCEDFTKGPSYCLPWSLSAAPAIGECQCRHGALPDLKCLRELEDVNEECTVSTQCRGGSLGKYSRCNPESGRCECYGGDYWKTTIYHNILKKCFPRKGLHDTCEDDDECQASLGPSVKCGKQSEILTAHVCYFNGTSKSGSAVEAAVTVTDCIHGHVYVKDRQSCWPISSSRNDHRCTFDAQCVAGNWGKHSQCSKPLCKCKCSSGNTTAVDHEDTFLVDGVCYLKRKTWDICNEDKDCNGTIAGDVHCKKVTDPMAGSCQCRDTHLWYSPMHKCLRRSTGIHDQCIVSYQCAESGLGRYSRCNPETNTCECYGGRHVEIFYDNVMKKCFPRRMFNETCEESDECMASLGPKVRCGTNQEHPNKMVCHYYDGDRHSPKEETGSGYSIEVITGAATFALALVGIALPTFYLIRRRCSRIDKVKQKRVGMEVESLLPDLSAFANTIMMYSTKDITSMTLVGEGCFGQVFKGTLNGKAVAVKKIKSDLQSDTIREMETVAKFSHPNILSLVGIVKNSAPATIWLLFEFMELGDLAAVLKNDKFKPSSSLSGNDAIVEINVNSSKSHLQLTRDTLLRISSQIANGMLYLSSHHFVHRDLAARNCLVGATGAMKISDFGLSRDVYASHYYKGKGNTPLPIRWMAPESITRFYFTVESDVWAYGIVLWEIYSWGLLPYLWLSNKEVMEQIHDVVLSPPDDCPAYIEELMSGCWRREPKSRLTFQQICDTLAALQPNSGGAGTWNESEYKVPISMDRKT